MTGFVVTFVLEYKLSSKIYGPETKIYTPTTLIANLFKFKPAVQIQRRSVPEIC